MTQAARSVVVLVSASLSVGVLLAGAGTSRAEVAFAATQGAFLVGRSQPRPNAYLESIETPGELGLRNLARKRALAGSCAKTWSPRQRHQPHCQEHRRILLARQRP